MYYYYFIKIIIMVVLDDDNNKIFTPPVSVSLTDAKVATSVNAQ